MCLNPPLEKLRCVLKAVPERVAEINTSHQRFQAAGPVIECQRPYIQPQVPSFSESCCWSRFVGLPPSSCGIPRLSHTGAGNVTNLAAKFEPRGSLL